MDPRPGLSDLATGQPPALVDRLGRALSTLWDSYLLVVDGHTKEQVRLALDATHGLDLDSPGRELRAALEELWAHYLLVVDDRLKARVVAALALWRGHPEPALAL